MTATRLPFLLLAVLLAVALPARSPGQERRPLVWAADAEGGEPYIFQDAASGRHIGFEVDLARALEKELGREIPFKQYDFKNLVLGLERGDFDLAMNGLEVTRDRLAQVSFTRPYLVLRLNLVVRASEERIRTLEDCRRLGLKVGALDNTAATRLLDERKVEKVAYDSQITPFQDLEIGRIDAVLVDAPVATYLLKDKKGVKVLEPPVDWKGYCAIAFRKTDEALEKEFDAALDHLLKTGELRRIGQKWGMWNDSQDELMPPIYAEGAAGPDADDHGPGGWTFSHYFPLLGWGALWTVLITLLSFPVAVAVGLPVAVARLYGPAPLRWLASAYVEFFRGIPVLLLLYLLYYALPAVGRVLGLGDLLMMQPLTTAVLGLGLNYAAYEAEIYRAGIGSIAAGQWEAAKALGMSPGLTFRRIILPQALRVILPPSTSDLVALFKDTSIASVITIIELSKQFQIMATSGASYAQIAEIGAVTATLYLAMSLPLGYLSRALEQRWAKA